MLISVILLLFIIFAPPIGYNLIKESEVIPEKVYKKEVKKRKVIQKFAKYPGAAIKYKELNSEYLQIKEKPVQYNPLHFDNGKISLTIEPFGEITDKDLALGLQFKIVF